MNIWSAIVNVVELFMKGGKPWHAFFAFLVATLSIMVVAVALSDSGKAIYNTITHSTSSSIGL